MLEILVLGENKMSQRDPIVIVSAKRTAMGGFMGGLTNASAPELGATAIKAAIDSAGINADVIDEVIMGCVLPAGLGQAPARQARQVAPRGRPRRLLPVARLLPRRRRCASAAAHTVLHANAA